MTTATSLMKWCPTIFPWRFWITFHFSNIDLDYIQLAITEHGCDPALPDNDGDMPIHIACLGGQLNVVKYLVTEMKCNPKSPGEILDYISFQ